MADTKYMERQYYSATLGEQTYQVYVSLGGRSVSGIFNVLDYGAVGDGTTDDYTAIKAAMDACEAAGGGILHFPATSTGYSFGTTLDVPSGVTLQGWVPPRDSTSAYESGLIYTGSDCALKFDYEVADKSAGHGKLENLRIEYGGSTASTNGIEVNYAVMTIDNVDITGFTGNGLDVAISIFSSFRRVKVDYCEGDGIHIESTDLSFPTGQIVLDNCTSTLNTGRALYLGNVLALTVIGGTYAVSYDQQILIEGGQNLIFNGVFCEPQLGDNRDYFENIMEIKSATVEATVVKSRNITIDGCLFDAGQTGSTAQVNRGIAITDGTYNISVNHCSFVDFVSEGIRVYYNIDTVSGYDIGHNYYYSCPSEVVTSGASAAGRRWEDSYDAWVYDGEAVICRGETATADDTTPSVAGTNTLWLPSNSAATAITNLDGGYAGQRVLLLMVGGTNSATISDGGNFALSANWTPGSGDTLEVVLNGTTWYEISRSNN